MDKEYSARRHPKHDEMANLIRQGHTNKDIASWVRVDRRAVARVRGIIGAPVCTGGTKRKPKIAEYTLAPDSGGHSIWFGRVSHCGTPVIHYQGRETTPGRLLFEARTGRPPVGRVQPECGVSNCLTPGHLLDEPGRRKLRMLDRELLGLPPRPWDVCPRGLHYWTEHGRLESDLKSYCQGCNTERAARIRAAKLAEATA